MSEKVSVSEETRQIFRQYSDKKRAWATRALDDRLFKDGFQWTKDEVDKLVARGQAPVVVNRIFPAVESAKAMLTANRPSFRVAPREDSDNQVAQALNAVIQYIWQRSDADSVMRRVIEDYYVTGMGVCQVYVDNTKDMGKGEICIRDIDPLDVYVDPSSRDKFCSDAENIIVSRLYKRSQIEQMFPEYNRKIYAAEGDIITERPVSDLEYESKVELPEDSVTMDSFDTDKFVRAYDRYTKVIKKFYRVFDTTTGKEDILSEEDYTRFINRPAWVVNGQIFTNEETAQQAAMLAYEQAQQQAMNQTMSAEMDAQTAADVTGEPQAFVEAPIEPPEIIETTMAVMVENGMIRVVPVKQTRVRQIFVIGQTVMFDEILPIDEYPIIFWMNIHNRTPFPLSDVRIVRSLQEEINKTRSLIIAHATTSTANKVGIPRGSVDEETFEDDWATPGKPFFYEPEMGELKQFSPTPFPGELYQKENMAKSDIDHQMGLYEFMMGNAQSAPQTYRATISLDEFGQRKIKSKLADIESGLKRMGEVIIPMAQKLYSTEKIIRIIQPNNSMSEYMINKRMYDDFSNVVGIVNDITVGMYDVIVVTGSTLPSNRYAQLEFYMEAFKAGIIDRQEVLKKTEIFDIEGVMQRTDEIANLQAQLEQAGQMIKQLRGDLQTREREVMHARMETEMAHFSSKLNNVSNRAEASTKLYEQRNADLLNQKKQKARDNKNSRTPRK